MPDNIQEIFSAPLEHLLVSLGNGIAQAQSALDLSSVKMQELIDADPVLSRHGIQATWYQMPRVDLQLKLAFSITEDKSQPPPQPLGAAAHVALRARALNLIAQPVSAAYQNHFNYNAQAASTITLSIVPVPPPRSGEQTTVAPRLTPNQVQKAALASSAKFVTTKDSAGNTIPADNLRFDVNFNVAARLWYVLQYDASDPKVNAVVVTVDDVTGAVRVIAT